MDIKAIIKESLLTEIGEASSKPYKWKLKLNSNDIVGYSFKTKGGSKIKINVHFNLIEPITIVSFIDNEHISKKEKLFYIKNPYYYWDTEFTIADSMPGEDEHATISTSKHRTDKVEVYRIMATLSEIINDLMRIKKVRGFAFRPSSDIRGRMFKRYFQNQLPDAKILEFNGGAIFITVNNDIEYIPKNGERIPNWERDWEKEIKNSGFLGLPSKKTVSSR